MITIYDIVIMRVSQVPVNLKWGLKHISKKIILFGGTQVQYLPLLFLT